MGLASSTHGYSDLALLGPFHGLSPTDYILPPLARFDMVFLLTVGYHPRLCSGHRSAVLSGCKKL